MGDCTGRRMRRVYTGDGGVNGPWLFTLVSLLQPFARHNQL